MKRLTLGLCLLLAGQCLAQERIPLAITIDDLPAHGDLPQGVSRAEIAWKMLETLKKHHVPEVYGFVNTARMDDDPDSAKVLELWRSAGYPLGNHTYSHADLNQTDIADYIKEITSNEATLKKFGKGSNWHYFRYPYLREGDTAEKRNAIRGFLARNHYNIAHVSVDFEDWAWNGPYALCRNKNDEAAIAWLKQSYLDDAVANLKMSAATSAALFGRQINHVQLLHIGAFDAEMLDELLSAYERQGVKFIPLSEALKDPVYATDTGVAEYGSTFPNQVLRTRNKTLASFGITAAPTGENEEKLKTICQ
jgi:peptidoglycan/xylan/chitin deacetylase (PgdA/CDA1 family)